MDDEDRKLTETGSGYWTRFAATGDPNGPGAPHWPAYDRKTDLCLEIGHVVESRCLEPQFRRDVGSLLPIVGG